MAQIPHSFSEETATQSTTSATYTDVSANAVIASTEFVAGGVYLITVTALNRCSNTAAISGVQVVHGASTAFADSVMEQEQNGAAIRLPYRWHTVWTAVSGERIALQQRCNGTDTSTVDQVTMIAIRLDLDLVEDFHWFQDERTTDDALGTGYVDGASVTVNPATAGDYLIIGHEQLEPSSTSISVKSRLNVDGTTSHETIQEGEAATPTDETRCAAHVHIVNLSAGSKTIKLQAAGTAASAGTRLNSKLFALRLTDVFEKHTFTYTEGALAGGTTSWADAVQTVSHTPTTAGDTWVGVFSINDHEATGNGFHKRMQVDGVDQPATQTSDDYPEGSVWDAGDQIFCSVESIENLSVAAHSVDFDGHVSAATAGRDWNNRLAFAISMELSVLTFRVLDAGYNAVNKALYNINDGDGTNVVGDGVVTLTQGRLYYMIVCADRSGGSAALDALRHDPAGSPLSFSIVGSYQAATPVGDAGIQIWKVAPGSTTADATIEIDLPLGSHSDVVWVLLEVENYDGTGTEVQNVGNNGNDGSAEVTMAAYGQPTNAVLTLTGIGEFATGETMTPESGHVDLQQLDDGERCQVLVQLQHRATDTTPSCTYTQGGGSEEHAVIGVEVKSAQTEAAPGVFEGMFPFWQDL